MFSVVLDPDVLRRRLTPAGQLTFCRRTWPRATSLPSSARVSSTSPELLGAPLLDRLGGDVDSALGHRAEEVGVVVDPAGELAVPDDRGAGPMLAADSTIEQ